LLTSKSTGATFFHPDLCTKKRHMGRQHYCKADPAIVPQQTASPRTALRPLRPRPTHIFSFIFKFCHGSFQVQVSWGQMLTSRQDLAKVLWYFFFCQIQVGFYWQPLSVPGQWHWPGANVRSRWPPSHGGRSGRAAAARVISESL
jgi:hypothetical protein